MTKRRLKAFFIGNVQSSERALAILLDLPQINMIGVLTLRQSRFNSDFADISGMAESASVPVYFADDTSAASLARLIRDADVDVVFAIGWSRLLSRDVLEAPRLGVVGFHPADLPRNRGRHPLIWALVLGLERTASTFFFMDDGFDSGPILSQISVEIEPEDDAGALYRKVLDVIPDQLRKITEGLTNGTLVARSQNHSQATYWRKRGPADGLIDWRMSARSIHNLVRGLTRPYVGAEFLLGENIVKLWKSEIVTSPAPTNSEPGKVLTVGSHGPVIQVGEDAIRLLEYDPNIELREGDYL
jgi:methionyl-tRNA formyltransferase